MEKRSIGHRQALTAMEEDEVGDPNSDPLPGSPPRLTMITTTDARTPINVRINLIRHKFATSTDQTTLQLFKTFVAAAKKTDPSLTVLPIDSTKQHLASLTSYKQIDSLTNNQLRLYFSSWFKDQHHFISGFLYLRTTLSIEDMQQKLL